jgi:signal transduction histidine kinase
MDGFQVLQTIRSSANLRDIIVIIISAVDEMDSIVRCIEMGAEDYLFKPFDPVLLRARLKTSLEKKKLRDLERAYLQQEMVLRQNEKLATLGKLSAGVAHELNNPAAAAQRSANQLVMAMDRLQQAHLSLGRNGLSPNQETALAALWQRTAERVKEPLLLDSLVRSDQQAEMELWLEEQYITDGWEYAPDLVALGYTPEALAELAGTFDSGQLPAVIAWLAAIFTLSSLAREIGEATGRISSIVKALKSYSYMDQAPMQLVDVHEGLDDTLIMLRHNLKSGIQVERDYAGDLPCIAAYGSELNQVWTNLIDNAIAAMAGAGHLTLRTRQENGWVVVTIEDTGHGIPESIQPKIFDPFFTTKPPGEGTGLGLNISHNVVVHKHRGQITVRSRPGETVFEVRLPIHQGV